VQTTKFLPAAGAEENAGRNSEMNGSKKDPGIPDIGLNQSNWLPGLVDVDNKKNFVYLTNRYIFLYIINGS